ncbi:MAG: M20/M25/M40 family metallo-hydrolase, partial [Halothermotrichaceae bacterium]
MNNKYFKVIIVILFFMLAVGLALLGLRTPRPLPSSAARDVFSAERALEHVKAMAREPHPTGSKANDEVREYIVNELESLGLTPKIQTRHVTGKNYTGLVKNVIVVLPGREADSKDKLAIVSHYDSVESGPGASDDGAAVAAMLETLRVFKNLPQLKNDIVFLFTDGEELGLLGAEQFVNANPLAKDIAFLLNFEARGTAGPSLMFETSSDNGKLIKEFASTVPYPNATSLTYEIYKRMPNDTDFTVFKNEGIPGMNFAFIFEGYNYHTADDNLDNLKLGTIQHHGSYALALLKHFGDIDLKQVELKTENRVYFDIMGKFLIHYPVSWVIPFLIITALLFVFFVIYNTKK